VTSDFRPEVKIWPFCTCAMHPAIIIGTVCSLWMWLWGRYHVPLNAFLVVMERCESFYHSKVPTVQTFLSFSSYSSFICAIRQHMFGDSKNTVKEHRPKSVINRIDIRAVWGPVATCQVQWNQCFRFAESRQFYVTVLRLAALSSCGEDILLGCSMQN